MNKPQIIQPNYAYLKNKCFSNNVVWFSSEGYVVRKLLENKKAWYFTRVDLFENKDIYLKVWGD